MLRPISIKVRHFSGEERGYQPEREISGCEAKRNVVIIQHAVASQDVFKSIDTNRNLNDRN